MKEIAVTLKDSEGTYTHKCIEYSDFSCNQDDEIIQLHISEAMKSFNRQPESVKVKIVLQVV